MTGPLLAMARLYRWPAMATLMHVGAFDFVSYYVYSNGNVPLSVGVTALCFFMALPFVFLLFMYRVLLLALLPVIFFMDSIAAYFVYFYKIDIRADTLAFLYETNLDEARGFLDPALIVISMLGLGVGGVLAKLSWKNAGWRGRYSIIALLALVPLFKMASDEKRKLYIPQQLPVQIVAESLVYFREKKLFEEMIVSRVDLASRPYRAPAEDITVVLVLGESARADHFSLNGYERPTNPKLKEQGVISYREVVSCSNRTRVAVPCLMTRSTEQQQDIYLREKSFVSLFRGAGFLTGWISNQRVLHKNDTGATAIAAEAEIVKYSLITWARAPDGVLLPWLREFLEKPDQRKLLVVHTIGSHWRYFNRYDAQHAQFQPVCERQNPSYCSREELMNAYDNSILYTDYFLSEAIGLLQGQNAVLVYTSDHGESLGESGEFGHGQGGYRAEQRSVPLIVWTSPEFQRRHPERYESMKNHAASKLSHDYIFHSIVDCAGLDSDVLDKSLSLCRGVPVWSSGSRR